MTCTRPRPFVPFTFISQSAASVFTPNSGPIAAAGDDQQVSPGEGCLATVTLDGSASTDADGQALTYEWASGGVILGTTAVLSVSLPAGAHTLELTVNDGQTTSTDTVTITVRRRGRTCLDRIHDRDRAARQGQRKGAIDDGPGPRLSFGPGRQG